jgi:hypothetical protein
MAKKSKRQKSAEARARAQSVHDARSLHPDLQRAIREARAKANAIYKKLSERRARIDEELVPPDFYQFDGEGRVPPLSPNDPFREQREGLIRFWFPNYHGSDWATLGIQASIVRDGRRVVAWLDHGRPAVEFHLTFGRHSEGELGEEPPMKAVALGVLVVLVSVSVWAWRLVPAKKAADQFREIWQMPWGRQLLLDFFGLEIVLALWMVADAAARGTWVAAVACIVAMPVFGSMSAALYWLLRAFWKFERRR